MLPAVQDVLLTLPIADKTAGRIFQGILPEGTDMSTGIAGSYVAWSLIANTPNNNLSDQPDQDQGLAQIDCYATDQTVARQLAEAVQLGVGAVYDIIRGPEFNYESDTKQFRWSMDCSTFTDR